MVGDVLFPSLRWIVPSKVYRKAISARVCSAANYNSLLTHKEQFSSSTADLFSNTAEYRDTTDRASVFNDCFRSKSMTDCAVTESERDHSRISHICIQSDFGRNRVAANGHHSYSASLLNMGHAHAQIRGSILLSLLGLKN